jgi:hypothetical protein
MYYNEINEMGMNLQKLTDCAEKKVLAEIKNKEA